jgi:hypothetical protein
MLQKTLVCLANSKKLGARRVAGVRCARVVSGSASEEPVFGTNEPAAAECVAALLQSKEPAERRSSSEPVPQRVSA